MTARPSRRVKYGHGARTAFKNLDDNAALLVVLHLETIAERAADARLPYTRITEVAGFRIAYELQVDQVCVWSIARL